jgi:hypothetical protein
MPNDRLPAWLLPEVKLASRPALLALILLLLVGLGAVLAGWSNRPESADFDLLAGHSSHKLDITSVDKPDHSAPAISSDAGLLAQGAVVSPISEGPAVLEIPAPDQADSPGPYKVPDLPPETPPLQPPEQTPAPAPISFDAGNLFIESSFRGDTPMIRTWKMLGYPAILAAALTTTPSSLSAGDEGKPNSDKSEVTLKDVNESLKNIQKKLEENKLNANIMGEDVRVLKEKVAQLERDVASLMRGRTTTANYPPNPPLAPNSGRVHLVNAWPEKITVLLNHRSIEVEPNREVTMQDVPAGSFTYEIMSSRPDNSILRITEKQLRTLAANETLTIRVYPR